MDGINIQASVKSLINLMDFCQRTSVKFEVYGFTSAPYNSSFSKNGSSIKEPKSIHDARRTNFDLYHLASSKVSKNVFEKSVKILQDITSIFRFGGTPLCDTIIAANAITRKHIQEYHTTRNSVIFLTDGSGSGGPIGNIMTQDRKVAKVHSYESEAYFLNRLEETTGASVMNVYLQSSGSDVTFRKNHRGFKEWIDVPARLLSYETNVITGADSSSISRSIKKTSTNKKAAKVFIKYIMDKIA